MRQTIRRLIYALLPLMTVACATAPPEIRQAPLGPPLDVVRSKPDQYLGQQVRWGGVIASIDNQPAHTFVQIVARPLHSSGRPQDTTYSPGRFLAQAAGFVEPTVYEQGREVTVVGTIAGTRTQLIGDHPYAFPVVKVTSMYLWEQQPAYAYDPYYYPYPYYPYYWDPFYPWGPGYGFYGRFHYYDHHHHYRKPDHHYKHGKPKPKK